MQTEWESNEDTVSGARNNVYGHIFGGYGDPMRICRAFT